MDKILDSKGIITDELNNIIEYCQELKSIYENNHTEMTKELNHINAFNKRLTQELKDKDKQLHFNEKTLNEYEIHIKKVEEEAKQELTEKERFSIMKAQDK